MTKALPPQGVKPRESMTYRELENLVKGWKRWLRVDGLAYRLPRGHKGRYVLSVSYPSTLYGASGRTQAFSWHEASPTARLLSCVSCHT